MMPTYDDGRICRIREEGDITRFWYRIDSTEFHVQPVEDRIKRELRSTAMYPLEGDIRIVLGFCTETL
jgi:hypothetical protein